MVEIEPLQLQLVKFVCRSNTSWHNTLGRRYCYYGDSNLVVPNTSKVQVAPPSIPQLTTLTSRSFTVMWQPPPLEEINGDIRRYTLLIVESETGRQFEVTTNDTLTTINSLHPYYNYLCRVRAETIQPGPYSVAISIRLLEEGGSN